MLELRKCPGIGTEISINRVIPKSLEIDEAIICPIRVLDNVVKTAMDVLMLTYA